MTRTEYKINLEQQILEKYGWLVSGPDLYGLLGYKTKVAFNQAYRRGTINVPVFDIANRRGKFALTKDIAEWMTDCRFNSLEK